MASTSTSIIHPSATPPTRCRSVPRATSSTSISSSISDGEPRMQSLTRTAVLLALFLGCGAAGARAQSVTEVKPPAPDPVDAKLTVEIFGFVMLDLGHDFTQIDPNWIDTMRVSRLPKVADEFGLPNRTFASVRQTRVGVRSNTTTDAGK